MICEACSKEAFVYDEVRHGWFCAPCFSEDSDLRAGITRAENDLAEARDVARLLLENRSPASVHQWRLDYPWLSEA